MVNPNNGSGQLDSDISRLLQELNEKIGLMVDVIEKHSRSGVPNSMYFNFGHGFKDIPDINETNTTKFSELSDEKKRDVTTEINTKYANELEAGVEGIAKDIKDLEAILASGVKDGVALTNETRDQTKEELKNLKEKFVAEKHNQEVAENLQKLKEAGYKNEKAYFEHMAESVEYQERTLKRRDASSKIAHSGLGNTWLGRGAQEILSTRQRADDIVNFGFDLKNGGAKNIATSLFGNGAVAKGATKALSGFGSVLKMTGGTLSGLSMGFKMGWAAVEKFADIVNKANAYILRTIKQQTNLDRLAYDRNAQLATLQNDLDVERVKYFGDLQLKQIEIESENLKRAVEISASRFVKATEIAVGPLTDGINETAYKAAEVSIDTSADVLKFQKEMELRSGLYGLFEKRRSTEFENYASVNIAEAEKTKAKYQQESALSTFNTLMEQEKDWVGELAHWGRDKVGAISEGERRVEEETAQSHELPDGKRSDSTAEVVQNNMDVFGKAGSIYHNRLWGIGYDKAIGVVEQELQNKVMLPAEWEKQVNDMYAKMSNTVAGIEEQVGQKQIEVATDVAKTYIDAAAEVKKVWLQLARKTENWVEEFDKLSNNLGIDLGYTNREQLKSFQESLLPILENTVSKFGKDREDMIKMQQTYIDTTGRQKLLNEMDYGQLFGLGKYLGDDGLAAQFASEMEIFNAGAAESVDLLEETLQNVNRIGLNGRKYAKEVANNLKMAQKYNFKGGTKGFMEMAKWAEKTRFNISSLGSMLDKVQEGGLEGVIKQSAEFQVLGGHAAMNSDPLGMMFDAWADPDAYAKRMQDMTKGFGTVDRKTGETKFNINESMQMAQIAKIQGRSVEDVRAEVMDRNRRDAVINSLSQSQKNGMSKEELEYLGSVAKYNRDKGRFEVELRNGQTVGVDEINSSEDLKGLMPEKHEERMETYMRDVLTMLEGVSGEEISQRANAAAATMETIIGEYAERTRMAHESYAKNRDEYIAEIIGGSKLATEKFHDFIGVFEQGNKDIEEAEGKINAQADKISEALSGVADVVKRAIAKINEEITVKTAFNETSLRDNVDKYEKKKKGEQLAVFGNGTTGSASFNDGIISGNDEPMLVGAQNIVPINDGSLKFAKPNKADYGYFMKDGGPLGEGMNNISEGLGAVRDEVGVLPDAMKLMHDAWNDPAAYAKRLQNLYDTNGGVQPGGKRDVNVNINGKLMLDGGGQQIDLLQLLKENPDLVRKITEAVINQMSSNANGGKYEMFSNRYYR